jgi:hypothetical protein
MGQEKGENSAMSYLNSITLVGFVGSDPEQRQAKGNGSKFTVLSIATQHSWKNADDEWSSKTEWHRVVVFRPLLAERVATTIKKGAHVLVDALPRKRHQKGDDLLTNLLDGLGISEHRYDVWINLVTLEGHNRLGSYQTDQRELMPAAF